MYQFWHNTSIPKGVVVNTYQYSCRLSRVELYFWKRIAERVYEKVDAAVVRRKRGKYQNKPTMSEILLGRYRESCEPQSYAAWVTLNKKGYTVEGAGFSNGAPFLQTMQGTFHLSSKERAALNTLPFQVVVTEVHPGEHSDMRATCVTFVPTSRDMGVVRRNWNALAEVLPDRGRPAPMVDLCSAWEFRDQFEHMDHFVDILRAKLLNVNRLGMYWEQDRLRFIRNSRRSARRKHPDICDLHFGFIDWYCKDRRRS